jgi:hypothetical protein
LLVPLRPLGPFREHFIACSGDNASKRNTVDAPMNGNGGRGMPVLLGVWVADWVPVGLGEGVRVRVSVGVGVAVGLGVAVPVTPKEAQPGSSPAPARAK